MYKLSKSMLSQEISFVKKDDGSGNVLVIPFDPDNTDYQAYLKWLEEGNTPLPPDTE